MNKIRSILLPLYVVALHTSMAGMEILSWTLLATTVSSRPAILKANRTLWLWVAALTLAVFIPLVTVDQAKGFWFQFGFMRWSLVLVGLTVSLQMVWSPAFERRLLQVWLVTLAVAGAYGVVQCLTGWDAFREGAVLPQGGGTFKAVGFFKISLSFAYSIGVSIFAVSLPSLQRLRQPRWTFVALALGGLGLISSMSRGAWLGFIFCMGIYFLFTRPRVLLPLGVAVGVVSAGLMWLSSAFSEKIMGMLTLHVDGSSAERLNIWQGYWRMFLDHPWFGVGLLQGDKLLPDTYMRLGITEEFTSHAHNNYLQFLAGAGLFGFVAFLAVVFIFLRKSWRLRKISPWGWSTFLGQLFFHLGGLTQANFIDAVNNHFLMFVWALVLVVEFEQGTL